MATQHSNLQTSLNAVVDNITTDINGSNEIEVKNNGITATQIANNTITRTQLASIGQQVSSSSNIFSTSSTSLTQVTNLSVTLTTIGRPVRVEVDPYPILSGLKSAIYAIANSSSGNYGMYITIQRNGTSLGEFFFDAVSHGTNDTLSIPPSSVSILDTGASAGSNTYTVWASAVSGYISTTVYFQNVILVAYEL